MKRYYSCAFRGRGGLKDTQQNLEINFSGISNCITSVAKDSYVLEKTERTRIHTEWNRKTSIQHSLGCDSGITDSNNYKGWRDATDKGSGEKEK